MLSFIIYIYLNTKGNLKLGFYVTSFSSYDFSLINSYLFMNTSIHVNLLYTFRLCLPFDSIIIFLNYICEKVSRYVSFIVINVDGFQYNGQYTCSSFLKHFKSLNTADINLVYLNNINVDIFGCCFNKSFKNVFTSVFSNTFKFGAYNSQFKANINLKDLYFLIINLHEKTFIFNHQNKCKKFDD